MRLDDRIAIITGAGRGIGRAIALAFAGAGADVVLVSRSEDELEAVAEEMKEHGVLFNMISPGPIRTQMTADHDYQLDRPRPSHLLEPDDVANAALYLASDLSGRVNAQIIHIRESNRW